MEQPRPFQRKRTLQRRKASPQAQHAPAGIKLLLLRFCSLESLGNATRSGAGGGLKHSAVPAHLGEAQPGRELFRAFPRAAKSGRFQEKADRGVTQPGSLSVARSCPPKHPKSPFIHPFFATSRAIQHVGAALGGKPELMPAPRVGAKGLSVCLSVRGSPHPRRAQKRCSAAAPPALLAAPAFELLPPACSTTGGKKKKKVKTDPRPLCRALSVVSGLQTFPQYGKTSGKPIPLGPAGERRCHASMRVSPGCKRVPENRRTAPKRWISAFSDLFADFSSLWPRVVMCFPGGQPWLHLPAPGAQGRLHPYPRRCCSWGCVRSPAQQGKELGDFFPLGS